MIHCVANMRGMIIMLHFGVIGTGNMGEALLRCALNSKSVQAKSTAIFDTNAEKSARLRQELGVSAAESMETLLANSDILLLAVKPNVCESLFNRYRAGFSGKALISVVAGWNRERLFECLPNDTRILRIMPNTPALVGEGMIVFEKGDTLLPEEKEFATKLFSAAGVTEAVEPWLINAVTGVSGSGPAYAYVFIEALADAAVREGLPRSLAYRLAAQTLLGSAKMVMETGRHPGDLKDMVCSPSGTTIEAVASLEEHGFRNAIMQAVRACCKRSEEMSHNI